ncbi:hypothetical protein OSB04_029876 [Centaurea solstitialis]|uniref:Ribonuclease H2 subunit B wHTH domain-containing protein n=1 Tax=Centaurea solstitialis TaxID=347529 RepID=A0AA38SRU3_9ASTR|nr:hypothetical protein OSB04_029876 [Centaurea solstitialis]
MMAETRLLVALSATATTGDGDGDVVDDDMGRFLSLHHPKSAAYFILLYFRDTTCYLLINGGLQELNWFKQSYGSWFLGDHICEDGGLYIATPVDPVFILLPMFDQARMKKGDDPGKFRQLDEILYVHDYPGYHHLSSIADKSMEVVCDCKEIGSTKFFRLNDSKVVAWMYYKVQQLKQTLPKLDKNYAARTQKDILGDAVMILGEYLKDEPWLKLLCNNLGLNMDADEVLLPTTTTTTTTHSSSNNNPIQQQTGNEKRVTRNTRANVKTKAKAKAEETNSHSIKDMFSRKRASRN